MAIVLVVDDEAAIVDLLVDLVEAFGHTALRAANGADALAIARERRPELILTDVMMPLMDGYALLQALRAEPTLANTAVFLMSAVTFAHMGQQPEPLPDGYLPKPFDLMTIEALLERLQSS